MRPNSLQFGYIDWLWCMFALPVRLSIKWVSNRSFGFYESLSLLHVAVIYNTLRVKTNTKQHLLINMDMLRMDPLMCQCMINQTNHLCAQRRLSSAWKFAQSDQSLRCPHEGSLGPIYPLSAKRRLIRLGGCPGWSKSLLGATVILLVLSCGGSYDGTYFLVLTLYLHYIICISPLLNV